MITVDEKLRDKIQAIHYQLDGIKDLIAYLWSKKPLNQEALDYYQKQYQELFMQFEDAKAELIDTYNLSEDWNLDYSSCVVTYGDDV